jgi:hypothetical protein
MTSKRVYFAMLGLIGLLLIGLIGGTYGINSLLQSRSSKLVNLKLQSQVLTAQQAGLTKAKKQVAQYTDLENIAQVIVPQDKDQAEAVREIAKLASDSGISQLSSITFPQSTLGGVAGATGISSGGSGGPSKLTQLTPVKGVNGVYELQITIQQSNNTPVTYDQFTTFLSKLEQNRRTAQVSSITLQPDVKNPGIVAFTLVINEFIRP